MSNPEKHHFQAEIQQLLNIVIHSLYTDKEIFIRELISNAADALEKLRFFQASGQTVFQHELPLKISVSTDEKENTITFEDTGVGMNHGELVENLGTIAHSGSRAFLKRFADDQKPDATLIGQFGVGFYSAFMVAKSVTVYSRSHAPDDQGWKWTSDGASGYDLEPVENLPRGTKIVLSLKEENKEFAEGGHVEHIIKRYSNFVPVSIELNGTAINTVRAIWARGKSELKDEDYNEFYQFIGHDQEPPLYRLHFSADAPLAIQALLFVPSRNMEALGMARIDSEVNLYCRKVLIEPKAKALFPDWLRFLKGVVDSEDLPLNISRETMQDTSLMQKLNKVLTGRFIKFLEEQSEKEPANYEKFFNEYGRFLKEGVVTDFTHRDALGKLLRFESSAFPKGQRTSLADYSKRLKEDQKEIHFILAPNRDAAESSPYFEVFQSKNYEVLFLYDPWDEFVMDHLREFEGKPIRPAEKAELKIETPEAGAQSLTPEQGEALAKWLKESLGDRVNEVRVSHRLVGSPAVVMDSDKYLTSSMRRILKSMNPDTAPPVKLDLEINPRHAIVFHLEKTRQNDSVLAAKVAEQVFDNARVAAGLMEDPRTMLKRLNELLEQVLAAKT